MNEKYVCDLEHSRKLVEAGWTRDTEFWWRSVGGKYFLLRQDEETDGEDYEYPAPLTDELLEELPDNTVVMHDGVCMMMRLAKDTMVIKGTPPNALSDLWIWYKEAKHD